MNCPLCSSELVQSGDWIDTETMQTALDVWHCNTCRRYFNTDELESIKTDVDKINYLFDDWLRDMTIVYGSNTMQEWIKQLGTKRNTN